MIRLLSILALILLVLPATAGDDLLSRQAPAKPDRVVTAPPAIPEVLRQGGDTIADATVIPEIPYNDTGTTTGFNDDYDEVCPYSGSTAPDVVYMFTAPANLYLTIDLYGSSYDTKVYVYDETLALVACNDDFYDDYTSKIVDAPFVVGMQYFIVVDGYGGDHGDYLLNVHEIALPPPCELDIPPSAVDEGEPPLHDDGVVDCHNGGCQFTDVCDDPWQFLAGDTNGDLVFHGQSGFYSSGGSSMRDTDWFEAVIGPTGAIEIEADAEEPTYLFELGPLDCNTVGVVQNVSIGACAPGSMTITGDPGALVWIWVGAQDFEPPEGQGTPYEFDYLLWISGLESGPVAVESRSWTGVKSLYR